MNLSFELSFYIGETVKLQTITIFKNSLALPNYAMKYKTYSKAVFDKCAECLIRLLQGLMG